MSQLGDLASKLYLLNGDTKAGVEGWGMEMGQGEQTNLSRRRVGSVSRCLLSTGCPTSVGRMSFSPTLPPCILVLG